MIENQSISAVIGLLIALGSQSKAQEVMDIRNFVEHCRIKSEICKTALEMAVFGVANGANNVAKMARRPDLAQPFLNGTCNRLVGQWKRDELVDYFNIFVKDMDISKTGAAPYAVVVGMFAISKECAPD